MVLEKQMNQTIIIGLELLAIYAVIGEIYEYIHVPQKELKRVLSEKYLWLSAKIWFVIYNFFRIRMVNFELSAKNMSNLLNIGTIIVLCSAGDTLYNSYLRDYKYTNSPKERKSFVRDMIILIVCISILTGIYLSYSI